MALKFAGTTYRTYNVYDHQKPIFVGKDKLGDDVFRANLVPIGVVTSKANDDAWRQAHNMCGAPVLELIGGANNVQ